ncbi:AfsR/SARP family transcriptional regulator [Streptomyces cellulosae]|uniref:AfsR/SARP family transcriptional regulator n=1 Tax=Streptomyces cellulosae TaxID=1968 RepID=UPI0004CAA493|nr:BTAD domain-containing putative transcriptional regulator [Streptomyces cellulosae]
MFDYRILGPLEVLHAGEPLSITAPRERDLLALLLLSADRTVGADELIDGLWGSTPPATARTTLHNYIKRLRRGLGDPSGEHEAITTRPGGYLLPLDNASLDLREFERLTRSAAEAGERGEHAAAAARLRTALALWRGDALADSRAEHLVRVEAPRLNDSRVLAFEHWVDAELRLGRHADVVADIQSQIGRHSLRESLYVRLLVALYRAGRRSDALAVYQQARTRLIHDIGLEPGPELTAVHRQILADDSSLSEPRALVDDGGGTSVDVVPVSDTQWVLPAQLPPSTGAFIGRREVMRRLDTVLPDRRSLSSGAVRIGLITGQAGAGKTTLAVRWGHDRRDNFPDGQLYANLHGYDAGRPARPIDVLSGFLRAFGVPGQRIPAEVEGATALYRSLCAGKQLLVVLDNARSAAQVRPLFPGSGGCLVLVTSRDSLGGLVARDGAVPVTLDVLEPAEAEQLLVRVIGRARVRAEPDASVALLASCAYLPLAVSVTAADLALHPERSIADQVGRLRTDPLTTLQIQGDEQSAVRTVLEISYAALAPAAARMFRLLGLIPGVDITVPAAAALAEVPSRDAADLLEQLTRAHLLEEHAPGRYTFHDLLRAYSRECLPADEHEPVAALTRLHNWYLGSVDAAVRAYLPEALRLPVLHTGGGLAFPDAGAAVEWMDGERANIVALVRHAAEHGPGPVAWMLADAVRPYMMQRSYASDWLAVASAGLAAAEADGSLDGQAAAHRSLSSAYMNQSSYEDSRFHDLRALDLYRRTGSMQGQSATLNSLALTAWYRGRLEDALLYGEQSVETCRAAEFRVGEAIGLANLGTVLAETGRLAEAQERLTDALSVCREMSQELPTLAAIAQRNLGMVLHERGEARESVVALTAAADMQRRRGSHIDLSYTLFWLAVASIQSGDRGVALSYIEEASGLKTGEMRAESDLHTVRALLSQSIGNHSSALRRFEEARELARRCNARTQELRALTGLAESSLRLGRLAEARAHADGAQKAAGNGEYGLFHAKARILLAETDLTQGDSDRAERRARQSLAFCSAVGHPLGTAEALLVLGHVLRARGDEEGSARAWKEALDGYESLGAARASEVRALLRCG